MRLRVLKTMRLHGLALCCCLLSASRLGIAQVALTAAVTTPEALAIAPAPAANSEDLPSAPEPGEEMAQSGATGQASGTDQKPQNQQDQTKPGSAPSLGDLGFTPEQTKADAQMQALLSKRTHMLKVHQTLGLITTIPLAATLITGPQAKAKGKNGEAITEPSAANLDFHIALGGLASGMYYTTAYYSIFAPKIPGVKPKGAIRLHRYLEWVHGPGMIVTPVLGILAYKQENAGEKDHGIAALHGPAAVVTVAAYGASIVAVSWPIHWKFWEGR